MEDAGIFVSNRLGLYADRAWVGVKRSIFGRRLQVEIIHTPEADCPE